MYFNGGGIIYGAENGCYAGGGWLAVFEDGGFTPAYTYYYAPSVSNTVYSFDYYSNSGSGGSMTIDQLAQIGGGVFWVHIYEDPMNVPPGCAVVNDDIKNKAINDVADSHTTAPQMIVGDGCGTWVPFPINFDDAFYQVTADEIENGNFDADYWNDVNLTFPPQTLPTFQAFFEAYPGHNGPSYNTPEKMYTAVGGELTKFYYDNRTNTKDLNTCALRISRALNYTGVSIPSIYKKTYKGADNKYYFVVAADLREWMIKTFGKPTGSNMITGAQGGNRGQNFAALMNGKIGIYIMTPNDPVAFQATGHADLLNYWGCDGGCFLPPTGGAKEVLIWILN